MSFGRDMHFVRDMCFARDMSFGRDTKKRRENRRFFCLKCKYILSNNDKISYFR